MRDRLVSSGIPAASMECLNDLFDEESHFMHPFSAVETPHKQLVFYRNHFNLIVSYEDADHYTINTGK